MSVGRGWPSSEKRASVEAQHATIEPTGKEQYGLTVNARVFLYQFASDIVEAGSTTETIVATAHVAQKGDVIRFTSGALSGREVKVIDVSANLITVSDELESVPAIADAFFIMRPRYAQVDANGNLITTPGPTQFVLNSVDTEVEESTGTPGNSRPLPVKIFRSTGTSDWADDVETALVAIQGSTAATATDIDTLEANFGGAADAAASSDTGTFSFMAFVKRMLQKLTLINTDTTASAASLATIAAEDFATETTLAAASVDLASIDAKVPSQGQALMAASSPVVIASNQSTIPVTAITADLTASGTITTQNLVPAGAATAGSAVLSGTLNGQSSALVQVTGTYTGALSLQVTANGTTWVTVGGTPFQDVNTGVLSATIVSATQGIFRIGIQGALQYRITGLAAMTGTATIAIRTSVSNRSVTLESAIPAGTNIIGALSANQSSNVAQINGVVPLMGNGITGTGSIRVTVASNNTTIPTSSIAPAAVTVKQAALTVGSSAVRLTTDAAAPTAGRQRLSFRPDPASSANFFYGSSGVTSAGATRGLPVFPGESVDLVNDAGDYYIISDTASQTVFVVEQE
jgi:hypothetical protein